jgi:hypothetical protein|tara:strand:- start:141 stop:548 length:408 start_codon:yes stop_codon:yes gene_type:complete
MKVELVAIEWLRAHEETRPKKVRELAKITKKWGCYTKPLLVDRESGSILDGHHRHAVGHILNLVRLPVVLFDYLEDDSITVEPWPNCGLETLTKQDIVEMSISDELYPPKTSRHTTSWNSPPIAESLERLAKLND